MFPQREAAHFFGYVYFRQVKDVSVKRGYFQKVTHLNTPGLCLVWSCDSGGHVTVPSSPWCWCPGCRTRTCSTRCCRSLHLSSLRSWSLALKQVMMSRLHHNHQPIRFSFTSVDPRFVFAVCNEIDQWLAPTPGQTLSLPVMGVILQVGWKGRGLQIRRG